jgi:predicted flap endonuclease-1-like 5' DNA nuclease
MNLSWTDLSAPLPIALAAGLVFFLIAWIVRSRIARRVLERLDRATGEELRASRLAANQVRAQLAHLTDDLATTRSQLGLSQEYARRVGAELDVQLRALEDTRGQRNFLDLELSRVQANAGRLTERIEQLAPLVGTVQGLEREVAAQNARATVLARKLEDVVGQKNLLESEQTRAAMQVEALEHQLREAARVAKEEFDRRARQLESWQAERARLRAEIAGADERHRSALAALTDALGERDEARARIRAVEVAAQSRQAEQEAAVGALTAQVSRLEPLRRQLEDREQLIRLVATERDARSAELERAHRAAGEATERQVARIRALEAEVGDANQARARLAELEPRLSKVTRERDQLSATLQRYLAEVETQRSEAKDRDARFRILAEEFRGTSSAKDQEIAGLKAHLEGLETQLQTREGADDLKRIRGIGPALERVLNEEGIYLYRQIATWTADDVARIAERLRAFPDRIHRDEWIASARTEHVRKYGEDP